MVIMTLPAVNPVADAVTVQLPGFGVDLIFIGAVPLVGVTFRDSVVPSIQVPWPAIVNVIVLLAVVTVLSLMSVITAVIVLMLVPSAVRPAKLELHIILAAAPGTVVNILLVPVNPGEVTVIFAVPARVVERRATVAYPPHAITDFTLPVVPSNQLASPESINVTVLLPIFTNVPLLFSILTVIVEQAVPVAGILCGDIVPTSLVPT
jgi:hypothetical protein